jgi:hypothetical protein
MFGIGSCIDNHSILNTFTMRAKSTYAVGQGTFELNFETISSHNYLLCNNYCTLGVVNDLIRCTS